MNIFSDPIHLIGSTSKRPYEIVAAAVEAWQSGDPARAEKLFVRGIESYRREEPDGLDFALGRCGAFYLDQGRTDDAEKVLKQAIKLKTDIPAIWSDYAQIIAKRRDFAAFTSAVEEMSACLREAFGIEFLLAHARAAAREGATSFAEQIARWAVDRCTLRGDKEGRWAAIGDLGRILERDGRLDDAMKLWRAAFDEGSRDAETITRLSMQLERAKDYAGAARMICTALHRSLPANLEESLRKRLVRCEEKTTPKGHQKKSRIAIPAYSIRRDSPLFEPVFQVRLKGSLNDLAVVNNALRCLINSKSSSVLVDLDIASGTEIRRVENLPVLDNTFFAADGRGLGVRRTAAVGKGPTLLRFMSADGRLVAESAVPDATSEIALGPDLWYVGCRNGFLYAFGLDGKQRWAWETPGSRSPNDSPYFRPCPYYVSSHGSFAAVSSMGDIYAVGPDGRTLWHAGLPNEDDTQWNFTVPFPSTQRRQEPYQVLGLRPTASPSEVKSAYRRLALATHPDRNPNNQDAAANFRQVQEAYERILAGHAGGGTETGITISIAIHGPGPLASFVQASTSGVLVGSSQGRIYSFDTIGRLREARVLGDGQVRVALRTDGSIGAAWCSDALLCFHENRIINAAESLEWPSDLMMWGEDIVLWRRNEVMVMDGYGRLRYALEFSKSVGSVIAQDDLLLCAAGPLMAFRKRN